MIHQGNSVSMGYICGRRGTSQHTPHQGSGPLCAQAASPRSCHWGSPSAGGVAARVRWSGPRALGAGRPSSSFCLPASPSAHSHHGSQWSDRSWGGRGWPPGAGLPSQGALWASWGSGVGAPVTARLVTQEDSAGHTSAWRAALCSPPESRCPAGGASQAMTRGLTGKELTPVGTKGVPRLTSGGRKTQAVVLDRTPHRAGLQHLLLGGRVSVHPLHVQVHPADLLAKITPKCIAL